MEFLKPTGWRQKLAFRLMTFAASIMGALPYATVFVVHRPYDMDQDCYAFTMFLESETP
jgi:hypothetical protein